VILVEQKKASGVEYFTYTYSSPFFGPLTHRPPNPRIIRFRHLPAPPSPLFRREFLQRFSGLSAGGADLLARFEKRWRSSVAIRQRKAARAWLSLSTGT